MVGTSIFGCDSWGVFSDKEGEVGPGAPLVKVEDADGDFHFAKREETGTWLNTGLHYQAWKATRPLTWSCIFFRAALTSPPNRKMVVSRDDCEAVQRCFITGDPLLLPARFSACQSLQPATSRI